MANQRGKGTTIARRIALHCFRRHESRRSEWAVYVSADRVCGYYGPLTKEERMSSRPDRFAYRVDPTAVTAWWWEHEGTLCPWASSKERT